MKLGQGLVLNVELGRILRITSLCSLCSWNVCFLQDQFLVLLSGSVVCYVCVHVRHTFFFFFLLMIKSHNLAKLEMFKISPSKVPSFLAFLCGTINNHPIYHMEENGELFPSLTIMCLVNWVACDSSMHHFDYNLH
jgi:hypothetical protein